MNKGDVTVAVEQVITLHEETVKRIVRERFITLREGQWLEGKTIMESFRTSHEYNAPAVDQSKSRYALLSALQQLEETLKNRGEW